MFEFANVPVAYILWALFGLFGGHRFYVGRWESGLVYMFTLGGCLVGWIIDGFILPQLVEDVRGRAGARPRSRTPCPTPSRTPHAHASTFNLPLLAPPPISPPCATPHTPRRGSTTSASFSSRC